MFKGKPDLQLSPFQHSSPAVQILAPGQGPVVCSVETVAEKYTSGQNHSSHTHNGVEAPLT